MESVESDACAQLMATYLINGSKSIAPTRLRGYVRGSGRGGLSDVCPLTLSSLATADKGSTQPYWAHISTTEIPTKVSILWLRCQETSNRNKYCR